MKLLSIFQRIVHDDRGATAIEYGLILALVFLTMLGGVSAFGTQVINMYTDVSNTSSTAMQAAGA